MLQCLVKLLDEIVGGLLVAGDICYVVRQLDARRRLEGGAGLFRWSHGSGRQWSPTMKLVWPPTVRSCGVPGLREEEKRGRMRFTSTGASEIGALNLMICARCLFGANILWSHNVSLRQG